MQRLGLCCLFTEEPIRFRTTTVRYVSTLKDKGKNPLEFLSTIIESNLQNLLLAVNYCGDHGIGAFRINSGLLPIYTHPEWGYHLDELPNSKILANAFFMVKKEARDRNIRLSLHPDQFVVLNSPKEDVVQRSLADLEYHGLLAKLVGADVINIHCGGGYGDKISALDRFKINFSRLTQDVQNLLTLENDDKVFTPNDLIPLCCDLKIPFVYDVHHHRCLPDELTIETATNLALKTWNREPLFHISSPKEGWSSRKPQFHDDFIDPFDVPDEWKKIDPLTIDVEAKAKEVAVKRLKEQLLKKGWNL